MTLNQIYDAYHKEYHLYEPAGSGQGLGGSVCSKGLGQLLSEVDIRDKECFDLGCGSGR